MITVLADENMVGLELLPQKDINIRTMPGRAISQADLDGVDVLWVRSVTKVTAGLVGGSQLRCVGTATAGMEHIDQAALSARQIDFAAAPGANANSVVEYVLSALAALTEPWERLEQGEALGVVGYGSVGSLLVAVARNLGWTVKVYDPWLARSPDGGSQQWDSFEEILKCGVICLHCSLVREQPWPSFHLLNREALASLSGSQWLINASRGAVIDNRALLEHLSGDDPVNCVLDVWEGEPAFAPALLDCPALKIATAHIAGYSWDAKWQATRMLYEHLFTLGLVSTPRASKLSEQQELNPVSGEGAGFARQLIGQRYDVRTDDALFRSLAPLSSAERSSGFDALRRSYRQRRELRGSRLLMPALAMSDANRVTCAALGIELCK